MMLLICRYKSLYGWHKVLQSSVLCLYLTEAFILFKMCICISCYLFQISVWHGLRFIQGGLHGLFLCMKQLFAQFKEELCYTKKWYSINLGGYSPIRISFMMIILFGISLAYSHLVLFRLFVGLHKINPVFLLISHQLAAVLGINSFYYEYSLLQPIPCDIAHYSISRPISRSCKIFPTNIAPISISKQIFGSRKLLQMQGTLFAAQWFAGSYAAHMRGIAGPQENLRFRAISRMHNAPDPANGAIGYHTHEGRSGEHMMRQGASQRSQYASYPPPNRLLVSFPTQIKHKSPAHTKVSANHSPNSKHICCNHGHIRCNYGTHNSSLSKYYAPPFQAINRLSFCKWRNKFQLNTTNNQFFITNSSHNCFQNYKLNKILNYQILEHFLQMGQQNHH